MVVDFSAKHARPLRHDSCEGSALADFPSTAAVLAQSEES
jgi:hypothetical protein